MDQGTLVPGGWGSGGQEARRGLGGYGRVNQRCAWSGSVLCISVHYQTMVFSAVFCCDLQRGFMLTPLDALEIASLSSRKLSCSSRSGAKNPRRAEDPSCRPGRGTH